jgi:hypothetical protein
VAGFVTVTGTAPGFAIAVAGIVAVSWPAVTRVVAWLAPFQLMTAFEEKLLPFTVNMNCGSPELAALGTNAAIVGLVPGCGAAA